MHTKNKRDIKFVMVVIGVLCLVSLSIAPKVFAEYVPHPFVYIPPRIYVDPNSILDSDIRGNYKYELIANRSDGCLLQITDLQQNKIVWGQKYKIRPDVAFLDDKALLIVTKDDYGDRDALLICNVVTGKVLQTIYLHGGDVNVSKGNEDIIIKNSSGYPIYRVVEYTLDGTNYNILSENEYTEPGSIVSITFTVGVIVVAIICLFLLIRDKRKNEC